MSGDADCLKLSDGTSRDRCLKDADTPHDDYKKAAEAAGLKPLHVEGIDDLEAHGQAARSRLGAPRLDVLHDETPIGRLVTRTISDIETLSDVFSEGLANIAGDILQLILIIAVMVYADWRLALISLSTIPFMLVSTYIFKEKVKKSFNEVRTAVSNLNSFVQEHITGMNIVQIFGSEQIEMEKFKQINKEHRKAHIKSIWYYSVYYPVADVIAAVATGLIVWYGATEVLNAEVSYGTITAFIMFINLFFRPIRMLADRFNTLQMGVVSTDRIIKLLESDEFTPNKGTLQPKELKGEVEFRNVWFAYNDDNYVLKDINFHVKPGETVAFVGATGAGKS